MSDVKRYWMDDQNDADFPYECTDGDWVKYEDYASLKAEVERLTNENGNNSVMKEEWYLKCMSARAEVERSTAQYNSIIDQQLDIINDLKAKVEHIDLLKSVVEKFFNSADLKNPLDAQSHCAITEKLKQLPACILDFTEEQVRDNPAWALAVFRHKVKEMQYKRVHDLNAIGGEQEENARLKAENERLTERNKFLEQIDSYLQGANENAYEKRCDELEAEVERLRKAGNELAKFAMHNDTSSDRWMAWNAAKEGKQP